MATEKSAPSLAPDGESATVVFLPGNDAKPRASDPGSRQERANSGGKQRRQDCRDSQASLLLLSPANFAVGDKGAGCSEGGTADSPAQGSPQQLCKGDEPSKEGNQRQAPALKGQVAPNFATFLFFLHCYVRPFLRLSAHALFIRANNVGPSFPPLDVKRDRVWSRRNGEQNKGTLDDTSTGASSVLLPDAYHRE